MFATTSAARYTKKALQLEEEGHKILKLNIGNPAPFGFEAPDEILVDVIRNLPTAQGYCDSKGLYSARKAIVHYYQTKGLRDISVNDVYIGNGVSELITMSMQALLNDGDEILIPAPDYPLWTAAATLAGGTVRHYLCDEENDWFPNLADMEAKITPKTKAIVVINPNNPTGAVYSKEILLEIAELARKHGLIIFADEIYDKILYDGAVQPPHRRARARPADHHLQRSFQSLPRCRIPPRLDGAKRPERTCQRLYRRSRYARLHALCANTPMQHAIQTALGGYQSINEFILPGGRCSSSAIKRGK